MAISGYQCESCGRYTNQPTKIEAVPTSPEEVGRVEGTWGPYCPSCALRKRNQLASDYRRLNDGRNTKRERIKREADQREAEYYRKWGRHSQE